MEPVAGAGRADDPGWDDRLLDDHAVGRHEAAGFRLEDPVSVRRHGGARTGWDDADAGYHYDADSQLVSVDDPHGCWDGG